MQCSFTAAANTSTTTATTTDRPPRDCELKHTYRCTACVVNGTVVMVRLAVETSRRAFTQKRIHVS